MDRPAGKPQLVRKAGILGFGLDCTDGHSRITRGDDFVIVGGSHETHRLLQAKITEFNKQLALRGKTLLDLTSAELAEIAEQIEQLNQQAKAKK